MIRCSILFLIPGVFLFCLPPASAELELAGSRPNIILVMTDDQGMGDLSCMGNPILKTPHLDRFYAQSTRFTDFQVSPTCAPTRAALMSGRPPFEVGVSHTIFQRERLAPEVVTFPQALQQAGYATGLFGKWHLGDDDEQYLPQKRGFDEVLMHGAGGIGQYSFGDFRANTENTYFDNVLLQNDTVVRTKGFCTDLFFRSALAWIRGQQQSADPWFAFISLNAPHGPMIAPERSKKRFLEQGYDGKTAGRYGMIENIDANVGLLMEKLGEWQALENTLVIFMTDNGMAMPMIDRNGEKIAPHNAGLRGWQEFLLRGRYARARILALEGGSRGRGGYSGARRPHRPLPNLLRTGRCRDPRECSSSERAFAGSLAGGPAGGLAGPQTLRALRPVAAGRAGAGEIREVCSPQQALAVGWKYAALRYRQ